MSECIKVRYLSRRYAKIAAAQHSGPVPKLTAYKCRDCGFWHLTSQSTSRKTFFRRKEREGS